MRARMFNSGDNGTWRVPTQIAGLLLIWMMLFIASARASVGVVLSSSTSPSTAQPGTTVNITGSGFPQEGVSPSAVSITLTPSVSGNPSATASSTALTTVSGTVRRLTFQVPTALAVTAPTAYNVSITGTTLTGVAFSSSNNAILTIEPAASLIAVTPQTGQPGQTISVTITGVGTNFVQGSTQATFGEGISVGGASPGTFGPVTVSSPTTAIANLVISSGAPTGSQTVVVSTADPQTAPLQNGFTIPSSLNTPLSITGLTNVVSLASFSASSQPSCGLALTDCFTIQQNFFLVTPPSFLGGGTATYWAQNALEVYHIGGLAFAKPIVNVYVQPDGSSSCLTGAWNQVAVLSGNPFTQISQQLSFISTLSAGTLTLAVNSDQNQISSVELSPANSTLGLTNQSRIDNTVCFPPELVLVGPPSNTTTTGASRFQSTTSGSVTSSVVLDGSYAAEVQEKALTPGMTATGETSNGLGWCEFAGGSLSLSSTSWTSEGFAAFDSAETCSEAEGINFEPTNGTEVLADNFTSDSALRPGIWTSNSNLLSRIAAAFSSSFISPTLNFSSSGMQMSGVNSYFQFGGIQMLQALTPPFSVQANVTGTQAVGNPYVLYLVTDSPTLSPYLTLSGNLNSANTGFYGIWIDATNITSFGQSLGQQIQPPALAALNTEYTIDIKVDQTGLALVSVQDTNGTLVGTSSVQVGTGPLYLVLGQREGLPSLPAGPNVAYWKYVSVTTGAN